MRIHSKEKIEKLKELRRKGYSIHEIMRELAMAKTTVWHHIQKVTVAPEHISTLKSKIGGSRKRKERNWKEAKKIAQVMLRSSQREYLIAFAMLYWAEGSKNACEFINSDGRMIDIYVRILTKVFNIPLNRISPTVRVFSGINEKQALEYWSRVVGISKNKFFVRFNDGGTTSRKKYGMCRIRVRKGANTLKLFHSLVDYIYTDLRESI